MQFVTQPHEFIGTTVVNGSPQTKGAEPQIYRTVFNAAPLNKIKFDLSYLKDTQGFIGIQTVFINNSDNDGKFYLQCDETEQVLIVKAGMQAYIPVFSTTRPKFTAWHDGSDILKTNLFFSNYLIAQGDW